MSRATSIQPRKPRFDFSAVPRDWLGGSRVATQVANAVNLLFPAGERFFVRSVKRYLDAAVAADPALAPLAKGFFGQEGRHAATHDAFNARLRAQGLRVDGFLSFYERLCYGFLERVCSHELALATTAAMEHYTAIMAENALRNGLLAPAHPTMRAFLHWHAAEEIEHRAVAFDVLAATDDRYALRAAGMAMATALLGLLWAVGAATLIAQDLPPARELPRELRRAAAVLGERRSIVRRVFLRGLREYLRPGFHPDEKPLDDLAAAALAELGLATAEEAAA